MLMRPVLTATSALMVLAACTRSDHASSEARVDTLPGGAIHVMNSEHGLWDSATAWRLEEELRIGPAEEGPAAFDQIASIAVDPAGRIWVLERQAQELRVFDSTGAHVRTIGRKGQGPGEFQEAIGMDWDSQGRLWVVDQRNVRYTVLDTAGTVLFARTRPISTFFTWEWRGSFADDGRLFEMAMRQPFALNQQVLVAYDSTLTATDTVLLPQFEGETFKVETRNMRSVTTVPFSPSLQWQFDRRGYVWFGLTAPFRIYQRRLGGDTVRIVERSYSPVPVTEAEIDSQISWLGDWARRSGGTIDRSRIPDHKPGFTSFFLDDRGDLWVSPVTADPSVGTALDVFDPEGRYLGRLRSPILVSSQPARPVFHGDRVYFAARGENDVPFVLRARIVRGTHR